MRTATWLNIGYGIVETIVGGSTGSSAALANGVHNFSDGISHAMHTATHKKETAESYIEAKVQNRRRWAAGAIAVGALITGVNAVVSLQDIHESEALNTHALAVELGAVAINTGLIVAIKRRNDGTLAYGDALRHHRVDRNIAVVTASSILVTPLLPIADGIGGLVATGASLALAYKTAQPHSHAVTEQSVE